MDKILELLQDDKEYYSGVGRNYLSNSDIGALLGNPKEFGATQKSLVNLVLITNHSLRVDTFTN